MVDNIKSRPNMLSLAFDKEKKQQANNLKIFIEPNEKIIPYRNIGCQKIECYYTQYQIEEYLDKKRENEICDHCKQTIEMVDFYLDEEFRQIIDKIFRKYNSAKPAQQDLQIDLNQNQNPIQKKSTSSNQIVPLLVQYINLQKKQKIFKVTPNFEKNPHIFKPIREIPELQQYDLQETQKMMTEFQKEFPDKKSKKNVSFNIFETDVFSFDIHQLIDEQKVNIRLMVFLSRLLLNNEMVWDSNWDMQIVGVVVDNFEKKHNKIEQNLQYHFIEGMENRLQEEVQELLSAFAIIFYYKNCWSLALTDVKRNKSVLMNFVQGQKGDFEAIAKLLYLEQAPVKISSKLKFSVNTAFTFAEQDLHQSGLILFLFFYQILADKVLETISEDTTAGTVKKLLLNWKETISPIPWIVLKCLEISQELKLKSEYKKQIKQQKTHSMLLQQQKQEQQEKDQQQKSQQSLVQKRQEGKSQSILLSQPRVLTIEDVRSQADDSEKTPNENDSQKEDKTNSSQKEPANSDQNLQQQQQLSIPKKSQQTINSNKSQQKLIQQQQQLSQNLDGSNNELQMKSQASSVQQQMLKVGTPTNSVQSIKSINNQNLHNRNSSYQQGHFEPLSDVFSMSDKGQYPRHRLHKKSSLPLLEQFKKKTQNRQQLSMFETNNNYVSKRELVNFKKIIEEEVMHEIMNPFDQHSSILDQMKRKIQLQKDVEELQQELTEKKQKNAQFVNQVLNTQKSNQNSQFKLPKLF